MIGVLVKYSEEEIIKEFFQLFKTPWEFFIPGRKYSVIITDNKDISELNAKLVIKIKENIGAYDNLRIAQTDSEMISNENGVVFPIFTAMKSVNNGEKILLKNENGLAAGIGIDHFDKRIIHLGFNLFDEVRYILSRGQTLEHCDLPTLDIHINNLRKWIVEAGVVLIEIPPAPSTNPFFVCLTHDVDFAGIINNKFDHTLAGFLYRAIITSSIGFFSGRYPLKYLIQNWFAVITLPFVYIGLKKDIWLQFEKYVEIEKGQSTYFWVPFKNVPGRTRDGSASAIRAVKYEVADQKDVLNYLIEKDCEIGVHGIDAWCSGKAAKKELSKIQELTGKKTLGVRMHWLFFDDASFSVLEKAGFDYDSTSGYNEKPGYRSGTLQIYKPAKSERLLELPMHIMDTALFYPGHMNLTFTQGLDTIKRFAKWAADCGGVLTLNWHDRSIAPERLWKDVYLKALQYFNDKGAKFITAGSAVKWFRKRRSIQFDKVIYGRDYIIANLTYTGGRLTASDNFVLRIHQPKKTTFGHSKHTISTTTYRDYPIDGNKNITISLL